MVCNHCEKDVDFETVEAGTFTEKCKCPNCGHLQRASTGVGELLTGAALMIGVTVGIGCALPADPNLAAIPPWAKY